MIRQSIKSIEEFFKEMRHIKSQALHFYRLYIFFFRNFRPPAVPEIMLLVICCFLNYVQHLTFIQKMSENPLISSILSTCQVICKGRSSTGWCLPRLCGSSCRWCSMSCNWTPVRPMYRTSVSVVYVVVTIAGEWGDSWCVVLVVSKTVYL